jgi:hypothetical protein
MNRYRALRGEIWSHCDGNPGFYVWIAHLDAVGDGFLRRNHEASYDGLRNGAPDIVFCNFLPLTILKAKEVVDSERFLCFRSSIFHLSFPDRLHTAIQPFLVGAVHVSIDFLADGDIRMEDDKE